MKNRFIYILASVFMISCSEKKDEVNKQGPKSDPPSYQLGTIEKAGVTSVIKLPAQLAAYEEVSIFPKVNGYVKTVLVDIGSKVTQNSLLMTLEDPELEQASVQAKEKYEQAKANFSIDKEHYQRLLEASKTAGAISPLDLSAIKAKMDADSSLCNAENANWKMQETMLGYLKVTAPFTGVITERNANPGALVNAMGKDKPMLELKQVAHLRLQVDIPENIAATLRDKDTVSFAVSAIPGEKIKGCISRRSDNLNMQYRSERVEIDVDNKKGLLSPGMYADVELHSKGNPNALCVPRSAVVVSTEKKYVLVVRNKKTVKVNVETENQNADKTEIVGDLQQGERIVLNANDEIKEGTQIDQ